MFLLKFFLGGHYEIIPPPLVTPTDPKYFPTQLHQPKIMPHPPPLTHSLPKIMPHTHPLNASHPKNYHTQLKPPNTHSLKIMPHLLPLTQNMVQ